VSELSQQGWHSIWAELIYHGGC